MVSNGTTPTAGQIKVQQTSRRQQQLRLKYFICFKIYIGLQILKIKLVVLTVFFVVFPFLFTVMFVPTRKDVDVVLRVPDQSRIKPVRWAGDRTDQFI